MGLHHLSDFSPSTMLLTLSSPAPLALFLFPNLCHICLHLITFSLTCPPFWNVFHLCIFMTSFLPLFTSLFTWDLMEEDFLDHTLKKKINLSSRSCFSSISLYFSSFYLALLGIIYMCLLLVFFYWNVCLTKAICLLLCQWQKIDFVYGRNLLSHCKLSNTDAFRLIN